MISGQFNFLELPFEVRHAIYEQLLFDLTVHVCPDESQLNHSRAPISSPSLRVGTRSDDRCGVRKRGNFYNEAMDCSSRHYQTLVRPGTWSSITRSDYEASDIMHLAVACKKVYFEIEPLLWSKVRFTVGVPCSGDFFKRYLNLALRSHPTTFTSRANVIQTLVLVLPRTDELASEMGRDLRYHHFNARTYVRDKVDQSLDHLTTQLPKLRSVEVVLDSSQLRYQETPHQIIPYVRRDVEAILRFRNRLENFSVRYSGSFSPSSYYPDCSNFEGLRAPFRKQLDSCERALWDMVTGKGMPLDAEQDETGWLGKGMKFESDDPQLNEFCERVIRHYNSWWMSLAVAEKEAIKRDFVRAAMIWGGAGDMSQWMLQNQI